MSEFLTAVRRNLGAIARFSGRTSRGQFWPYAGMILGLMLLGIFAVTLIEIAPTIGKTINYVETHADQGRIVRTSTSVSVQIYGYHPELMPDFGGLAGGVAAVLVPTVLLLAAAVSRRLHDVGWPAWVGLAPLPFLGFGLWAFPHLAASFEKGPDLTLFLMLFANNLAYLATLGGLALLLSRPGTPEQNRHGQTPELP